MKDYRRLTKWSELGTLHVFDINGKEIPLYDVSPVDTDNLAGRLADFEDKIERGEFISTVQSERGEQEIAFFVKHNAEVRKQAVREFAEKLRDKEFSAKIGSEWVAVVKSLDIDEIVKEV